MEEKEEKEGESRGGEVEKEKNEEAGERGRGKRGEETKIHSKYIKT